MGCSNRSGGVADLDEALATWSDPSDAAAAAAPIYHLLSMESADPIEDPDDVAFWWDAGLRVVGPAHFGDNTYIHGTGTEGGLKPPAADLYRAMREAGMSPWTSPTWPTGRCGSRSSSGTVR